MPKINQEEYEVLKKIRKNGYEEIRRNSIGDIAVRVVGEKVTSHQYQTEHNDKFKFMEATGDYWSIAELIEEYEEDYKGSWEHAIEFSKEMRRESEETEVKTLESIREEIWEEMLRLEDKRKDQWADIKYQTLREVLQKLGHLDEPEVLSQEWIDENEVFIFDLDDDCEVRYVPSLKLRHLLVPKQELPSIPQFVADILEEKTFADLPTAFEELFSANAGHYYGEDVCKWIVSNEETFARAWLDGYTVEEEQKYYVLFGNQPHDDNWTYVLTNSGSIEFFEKDVLPEWDRTKLTEQEIKDYDKRYFPFAVKVEELGE